MNVSETFGLDVFNYDVMSSRLPKDIFDSLRHTIDEGKPLAENVANAVANAMKDWAIEKGATHFTHWFQPMTGVTAEKHDGFLSLKDNKVIMEFSGKELVKGEPDASSFPSGGIRATFEARGYTAWDPTSFAFVRDGSLYIPTAFCAFNGEVLDKKTPLLRSMDALDRQAKRILALFGKSVKRVNSTVGAEQEYFLIDKKLFNKRDDLKFTGRTLFGAKPPKGQEFDDHYFGTIRPRVAAFMRELDEELWKLGVPAKTKHNETAPSQHELASIFETANVATDHNQLTMDTMKKLADKHGLACVLHEKPFKGVNGSGKHNNWSLATDEGKNLLDPGTSPEENAQFLLFITAVIAGVDEYQDLLRTSVATAGNDHRLGANEAPPAIISMFLGDELTEILDDLVSGVRYKKKNASQLEIGVHSLPRFPKDATDRNRTSPFAFTGNKFEFRMVGSSQSIAGANIVINTIVAEELRRFADVLENASDLNAAMTELVQKTIKEHRKIIFNGNNYAKEWIVEAEKRGLLNLKTTPEAIERYLDAKNIELFVTHKVFNEVEIRSRAEIMQKLYSKTIRLEARTLIDMVKKNIFAAVTEYQTVLSKNLLKTKEACGRIGKMQFDSLVKIGELTDELYKLTTELETDLPEVATHDTADERAELYCNKILAKTEKMRVTIDELETLVGKEYWPYPTYSELLFSV